MAVAVQGLYSTGNLEVILEQKLLCENNYISAGIQGRLLPPFQCG